MSLIQLNPAHPNYPPTTTQAAGIRQALNVTETNESLEILKKTYPHANALKLWAKLHNMQAEPYDLDINGKAPLNNTKQAVWLHVGDSIAGQMFDYMMSSIVREYSPSIPYVQNGRTTGVFETGGTQNNGFLCPIHITATTTGTIFEKNQHTPDYTSFYTGSKLSLSAGQTITFGQKSTNYGGASTWPTNAIDANTIKVFYKQVAGAGVFKIQTSTTSESSGFSDLVTGISADNAGAVDAGIETQSITAGKYWVRIEVTSGTVEFFGWSAYRNDIPQVLVYDTSIGSLDSDKWATADANLIGGFLSAINPDLVVWSYNDSAAQQTTGVNAMAGIFSAETLTPSVVLAGNAPTSVDNKDTNDTLLGLAETYNWVGFSGYYVAGGSYSRLVEQGLNGDGIHSDARTYYFLNSQLMEMLAIPAHGFKDATRKTLSDLGRSVDLKILDERTYTDDTTGDLLARFKNGGKGNYIKGLSEKAVITPTYNGLDLNPEINGTARIDCPNFWATTTDFTVVMLVDINYLNSHVGGNLFAWSNGNCIDISSIASTDGGFRIGIKASGEAPSADLGFALRMNSGDNVTNGRVADIRIGAVPDGLVFFAITYNHTSGDVSGYLDGQLIETRTGAPIDWNNLSLENSIIGNDLFDVRETSAKIYYFGLYDAVLSAQDVNSIYNNPSNLWAHSSAKAVYTFEERNGINVFDKTNNENDASINGTTYNWLANDPGGIRFYTELATNDTDTFELTCLWTSRVDQANSATNYTITKHPKAPPTSGTTVLINAPVEPTVNNSSANKVPDTAAFAANTNMHMIIETIDNGATIRYYFVKI